MARHFFKNGGPKRFWADFSRPKTFEAKAKWPRARPEPLSGLRQPKKKLRLILERKNVLEDQQGEWIRKNDLHTEHLHQFEQEIWGDVEDD